jgi:hypothetical protein
MQPNALGCDEGILEHSKTINTQRMRRTPGDASPEVRIRIANFLHERPNYYRNNCNVERILSSLLGRLLYKKIPKVI